MEIRLLDSAARGIILGILVIVIGGVGLKIYTDSRLREADAAVAEAKVHREVADKILGEAKKMREASLKMESDLAKANAKLVKLEAALNAVKVPPKPTELPASIGQIVMDLRKMGLELPSKPSLGVAPSITGFTSDDAGKVWYWSKEAIRVPALELKIEKQNDLIQGVDKARILAQSLAEARTREADALLLAASERESEAAALRSAVESSRKALKAEQRKKYLYAIVAAAGTYAATRR